MNYTLYKLRFRGDPKSLIFIRRRNRKCHPLNALRNLVHFLCRIEDKEKVKIGNNNNVQFEYYYFLFYLL